MKLSDIINNSTTRFNKLQENESTALPPAVQHFIRHLTAARITKDDPKFVDITLADGTYRIRYEVLIPDPVWAFDKPQAWSMTQEDAAIVLHHWRAAERKHDRQLVAQEIMGDQNSEKPVFVAVFL